MTDSLSHLDSSVRHGYAQVGDVRLHYAESGEGERLVVLLHGFPECWYSWRHQLAVLGERFHVVAHDMRGYNLSDRPEGVANYKIEKLVDDVTGLIRHLGARRAAVIGHDWGAGVAWAVAQRNPEYVSKLAALQVPLGAAWKKNITLRQMLKSWYMFFFQLPKLPEWWIGRDDFAELDKMFRASARPGTFTETDLATFKSALRRPGALTAALNYYRANVFTLLRGEGGSDGEHWAARRVTVPTLFVYGERDPFVLPETVRGLGDFIDAPYREVRLARAGHWVQQEYPQEVNAALTSFLEE